MIPKEFEEKAGEFVTKYMVKNGRQPMPMESMRAMYSILETSLSASQSEVAELKQAIEWTLDDGKFKHIARAVNKEAEFFERMNKLDAEVAKLRAENEKLKEWQASKRERMSNHDAITLTLHEAKKQECESLRESNIGLCEALSFYADWKNWKDTERPLNYERELSVINPDDISQVEYVEADGDKFTSAFGGYRARAALARFGLGK